MGQQQQQLSMSVDYDWYIHVYIPYLKRWICLKKFRFDYRCRSNTCYFEWIYSDSQTTMSPHYMDPVEFQFVTGEKTVIVDPKDPQHDGAVWDPNVKRRRTMPKASILNPVAINRVFTMSTTWNASTNPLFRRRNQYRCTRPTERNWI